MRRVVPRDPGRDDFGGDAGIKAKELSGVFAIVSLETWLFRIWNIVEDCGGFRSVENPMERWAERKISRQMRNPEGKAILKGKKVIRVKIELRLLVEVP
jgi:hypothetical protein